MVRVAVAVPAISTESLGIESLAAGEVSDISGVALLPAPAGSSQLARRGMLRRISEGRKWLNRMGAFEAGDATVYRG
jgi:hypothetical protein